MELSQAEKDLIIKMRRNESKARSHLGVTQELYMVAKDFARHIYGLQASIKNSNFDLDNFTAWWVGASPSQYPVLKIDYASHINIEDLFSMVDAVDHSLEELANVLTDNYPVV